MAHHPIGLDRNLTGASPEQREAFDVIARGPRGSVPSPFLAMLDAPGLTDCIQKVGAFIRYESSLSAAHRELAILATAGAVGCNYEWNYHAPIARDVGTPEDAITATLGRRDTRGLQEPWGTIIDLVRQTALEHRTPASMLDRALDAFGRRGATELIAIAGYYSLLANFILIGGHEVEGLPSEAYTSK